MEPGAEAGGRRGAEHSGMSPGGRAKGGPCCVPCTPALAPAIFCFARATGVTTNSTLLLAHALFSFLCLQMCIFLCHVFGRSTALF